MSLPRIFFDTNDGSHEGGYWLGFRRSAEDLDRHQGEIGEGAKVVIYMPDELEMVATLRFDGDERVWWADPVPNTIKYLDGSDQP
jgi:hypothetical protein